MFAAAIAAFTQIFTPPFRAVLWKTLGLTVALLTLAWIALDRLIVAYAAGATGWLATLLSILTGLGLFFLLAYLVAPVSALVAGFFLDELAERVEADPGPVGRALPAGSAIWIGAKFALVSVAVNLVALLVFSPVLIWNAQNGWISFAFQGGRAGGARLNLLGPLTA